MELARGYPSELDGARAALKDPESYVARSAFDLSLITAELQPGATVVDVGGGSGLLALALARRGYRAILIDDFFEHKRDPAGRLLFDHLERGGVEIHDRDVVASGLGLQPESVDAVSAFHVLEHLHGSPRGWFQEAVAALRPGGTFVLAGPNAVNLRKRLTVPLGKTNWSTLAEWYYEPVFRGHVREPVVADFAEIAGDLGLERVRVVGRNFLGGASPRRARRVAARLLDRQLRLRPSLCSDLYVVGTKPHY